MPLYDRIGTGYARARRPDPGIAATLHAALASCGSVVNVGAGTGGPAVTPGIAQRIPLR